MALLVRPTRLLRSAIVLKPSTLLALHKAMSKRKYRMLFSPNRRRKPGPKGPSAELIRAVVEMKHVTQLGLSANRTTDRLGVQHPNRQRRSSQDSRPSLPAGTGLWWSFLVDFPGAHQRQPLEHGSVPVRIGYVADPLGLRVVIHQYTRRIIGFGVHAGTVDGAAFCKMFNRAIRGHRWMPNSSVPITIRFIGSTSGKPICGSWRLQKSSPSPTFPCPIHSWNG